MNDHNLTAVSVETLAEMTHPYLFNHLKKPSWRALWDTVGSQSADSMPSILKLMKTAKQSISDQALVLLNNLMNCKEVRLAVGRCGEIPEFVKLCEDASHSNFLPYLQCFALCCKESVNRAKVRQSDGLDVLLKVLKNSEGMQERHVALAGLVQFYHDNLALKYLCTKGLIKSITTYLGEYLHYLQGDMKVCKEHFSRPYYEVPAQCSDSRDETVHSLSKSATPVKKSSTDGNEKFVGVSHSTFLGKMASSAKPATSLQIAIPSGGTFQKFSSSCHPSKTDSDTDKETLSSDPAHGHLSPKVTIDESPTERSSATFEEDSRICDEYSQYVGQNAAVYSPPRVDWSSVFACREQQGYRGLSPQSDLSSRSNSMERDIPGYQYSLDWSMSPRSDASWAMAGEDPEVFQYSPVVSDEEDAKEDETDETARSPQTTPERPSKVSSSSGDLGSAHGFDINQSPSSSKKFALEASSPSIPIYSPAKHSRSPSVDSSYDSEALEDFSDEDQSKPEGYALHLLSKCSYIDDTLEFLAVFEVIDVLLKLVLYVPQFQQRSTRILNRILGNRLTFEQLVKEGIPRYLKTSWRNVKSMSCHFSSEENPVDPSTSLRKTSSEARGRSGKREKRLRTDDEEDRSEDQENDPEIEASWCPFMDKLASVCESRFGLGVLAHGVTSPNLSQRLAVLDAVFILCRSQSGLHYLLIDSGALDLIIYFLRRRDLSDSITANIINGLQNVSCTLKINRPEGDRLHACQLNMKQRKLSNFDPGQDIGQVERKASATTSTSLCEYELSEKCKDVRLVLSEKNFLHASREFLCQRSEYFSLLLQGSYKESRETEVSIPNISRCTLERILHYLYGCQLHQCSILNDIDLESGMELLAASGRFLLPELQRTVAESSLQNQVTADNVATVCIFASIHGCQCLWSYCIRFMLVNDQVGLSSFQKLSESSVAKGSFSKMKSIIKDALKLVP
ncbi:Rho-related BTB domain-containing protein 1 [Holothuria leucospilota]|uniref:Rho-related BTB domain-containing protein 1 n=1 Tax=Holothuria leucospilota TaxID=206669 RepID=A0A9Q1CF13_HOLLE|nr:Rho-related BTB domain-containing protein 1 [Holothuria leucospilota]